MNTSPTVAEMVADAREFLDGPVDELIALLEGVAALGAVDSPRPSPELALLLAGRPAPRQVPNRHPRPVRRPRHVVAGLAAAAVAGLSVTGAAAFANELPPTVQRAVARFSESYLPFSFPQPPGDVSRGAKGADPGQPGGTAGVGLRDDKARPAAADRATEHQKDAGKRRSLAAPAAPVAPVVSSGVAAAAGTRTSASVGQPSRTDGQDQVGRDASPEEPVTEPQTSPQEGTAEPGRSTEAPRAGRPATPPGQADRVPPVKGRESVPEDVATGTDQAPPEHAPTPHTGGGAGS